MPRMVIILTLLVALAVLAACSISAPAQAGSVIVTDEGLIYEASPGETNNLTITQSEGSFTVVDNWPLTALGPCSSMDLFTAVCTATSNVAVTALLGDLDDTAVIVATDGKVVAGGAGADTISVSFETYGSMLMGGNGDDTLGVKDGGGILAGGNGDDTLTAGMGPRTTMVGGLGSDTFVTTDGGNVGISYRARTGGVTVTPDGIADDGAAGEGDNVLPPEADSFINVSGGHGNDRLSAGPTGYSYWVYGRGGNDVIDGSLVLGIRAYGGGGDDRLLGGTADDELFGGEGRDTLLGGLRADSLEGGRGNDVLRGEAGRDSLDGGGGDDLLVGGGNHDWSHGGGGNDTFRMRDGRGDRAFGGLGRDRARIDPGLDRLFGVESIF